MTTWHDFAVDLCVEKRRSERNLWMVDFAKQTTTNYVRFYPISPAAKKYVENRHGFYEKYYKPRESCTVFELPEHEGNADYYARRLVEAGFHVQDVEGL